MRADRNMTRRSAPPDRSSADELDQLRATCSAQKRELQAMRDTVATFRNGALALAVENDQLRVSIDLLQALDDANHPSADSGLFETKLALDPDAPAAARRFVTEILRDRAPHGVLDRARLIVSELIADNVDVDGRHGHPAVLRIACSRTSVRLELEAPGRDVPTDRPRANASFSRHLLQTFSDRWGGEQILPGGIRSWAEIAITTPAEP